MKIKSGDLGNDLQLDAYNISNPSEKLPTLFEISPTSEPDLNFVLCGVAGNTSLLINRGQFCVHAMTSINNSYASQLDMAASQNSIQCKSLKISQPNIATHILLYDPPDYFQYGYSTTEFFIPKPGMLVYVDP